MRGQSKCRASSRERCARDRLLAAGRALHRVGPSRHLDGSSPLGRPSLPQKSQARRRDGASRQASYCEA
jgi:hypothetical protein